MQIRVKPNMVACECGWYLNTLTGESAMNRANLHNKKHHNEKADIVDERVSSVQSAHE